MTRRLPVLATGMAAVLALAGAAVLVSRWWVPVEEDHLEDEFGVAYRRYRNQTPRWLVPRHT